MKVLAGHCSQQSRKAADVSREVESSMVCQYMEQFKGQNFAGIISGVTSFGFFVELEDTAAEGLVHISSLNSGNFKFDEAKQQLSNGRQHFALGDKVDVVLNQVDLKQKKMDFIVFDSITMKKM